MLHPFFHDRLESALFRLATATNERLSAYRNDQPQQLQLVLRYRDALRTSHGLPAMNEVGFRCYSQFDEDGLLLYILSLIGMGDRRCIDIGAGRPMGSNSTNLFVNWSFKGTCIDGDSLDVRATRRWYDRCRSTMFSPPTVSEKIVDQLNINELVEEGDIGAAPPDVLSLDIDGIDYWVWQSLRSLPRIVIAEFNPAVPQGHSVTVPEREPITPAEFLSAGYYGCSLEALIKLGALKGYRFVGISSGVNAFFVLESEIPDDSLPRLTASAALASPRRAARFRNCEDSRLLLRDWVDV